MRIGIFRWFSLVTWVQFWTCPSIRLAARSWQSAMTKRFAPGVLNHVTKWKSERNSYEFLQKSMILNYLIRGILSGMLVLNRIVFIIYKMEETVVRYLVCVCIWSIEVSQGSHTLGAVVNMDDVFTVAESHIDIWKFNHVHLLNTRIGWEKPREN